MIAYEIPKKVKYILEKLNKRGYEAYIVGGCVRDTYMGVIPKDWDITTNAIPEEIKKIFPHTVDTGIKHGTVTVIIEKEHFEITTYRIDGEYIDRRRPNTVEYTQNLLEDLRRRDFTINSMAYNTNTGIIDPYNGISDIKRGIIRAVGCPNERFDEDALRILRGIRFSARFNYTIEEETYNAMLDKAVNLSKISYERIRDEIIKTLESNNPEKLILYKELGVLKAITKDIEYTTTPEFDKIKKTRFLYIKIARLIEPLSINYIEMLRNFRLDNKTIKQILAVLETKIVKLCNEIEIKLLLNQYGVELTYAILGYSEDFTKPNKEVLEKILKENQVYDRKHLVVTGSDFTDMAEGKEIKEILDYLTQMVIHFPDLNNREKLIEIAKNKFINKL